MSTISTIAMDVNSLMGNGGPLLRNHQSDLIGSTSAKVMDRINYYNPSSGGEEYGYYGGESHQKGGKRSVALTALTLLAFLFFLHILQNCIQEQTDMMNPQVVIMQARLRAAQREAEASKRVGDAAETLVPQQLKVFNKNGFKPVENVDNRHTVSLIDDEKYEYTKLTHQTPLKTIQRTD